MYYKCLKPGRVTSFQNVVWPVRAKRWTPLVEGILVICGNGWHLATEMGLSQFLVVGELWTAKGECGQVESRDKCAFGRAMLLTKIGDVGMEDVVILAKGYAEHVKDLRNTAAAADVARAADAAAYADAAAATAARAAYAADAAAAAAYDAAHAAAYAAYAAYDAAAYAAADAERQWQHDFIISHFKNKTKTDH